MFDPLTVGSVCTCSGCYSCDCVAYGHSCSDCIRHAHSPSYGGANQHSCTDGIGHAHVGTDFDADADFYANTDAHSNRRTYGDTYTPPNANCCARAEPNT